MTNDEESGRIEHSVDAEFADYVARLEAGEEVDFEAFLALHPEHEVKLRELHEAWARVRDVLGRLGLPSAPPRTRTEGERAAGTHVDVPGGGEQGSGFTSDVLERLAARQSTTNRYQLKGEVARGGMGVVYRVWDEELRRNLAMKVILDKGGKPAGDSPASGSRAVSRFLEEAQVTGQLNHPGIVPLHELGVDAEGQVYFTMSLVKGQSFSDVLALVASGSEEWPETRALSSLLRICETMAYAHNKGVIHRDLKPSNVLIGPFGATYVIDWGLARVLGQPDKQNIRLAGKPEEAVSVVQTERHGSTTHRQDSPLVTQDGDVVGTPSYMAPEQARGEIEEIGPASDVYSVGAMLYQLLAGRAPYIHPGTRHTPHGIWRFVLDGPPKPIAELASGQPPELIAICEKAMSREAEARYADMREMATDLRAFLEHRVVQAYRTGPLVELRKWVARNRLAASALAAAVIVAVVGGFTVAWVERQAAREIQTSSDAELAHELLAEEPYLGPIHPENTARFEAWLQRAKPLTERLDEYRARLAEVVSRNTGSERQADPAFSVETGRKETLAWVLADRPDAISRKQAVIADPNQSSAAREEAQSDIELLESDTPRLAAEVEALEREVERRELTRFFDVESDRLLHDRLDHLVHSLEELLTESSRVEQGLAHAQSIERLTVEGCSAEWQRAITEISSSDVYDGLSLVPQIGLIPLGTNEQGLWEFWHPLSGARPVRDPSGRFVIGGNTGIIFVLIPAASSWMGAEANPAGHNYMPKPKNNEGPVHLVHLDAFFMSKYELTQGQWYRAAHSNPSEYFAGSDLGEYGTIHWTHPVERVTWMEAFCVLERYGLALPTEAQWERTARCGSELPYVYGDLPAAIESRDNFFGTSDGFDLHAPVDSFPPNKLGVCGLLGNVREWCLDWATQSYADVRPRPGDGRMESTFPLHKITRGGGFRDRPVNVHVALRRPEAPSTRSKSVGVRPARPLIMDPR